MSETKPLTITNPRILSFFARHQNLDPEQSFLSFVDIMEKLSDSVNNTVNNTLVENFLTNLQSINEKITTIDSNIVSLRHETLSNFSQQMSEFKKEYMENLRLNLTANVSDKIEPFIKDQMNLMMERTSNIFSDTLPKNNKLLQESLQNTIASVNSTISDDTRKLYKSIPTQESLQHFFDDVDAKMTQALVNSQQMFATNLSSAEKRLDDRISSVKQTTDGSALTTNTLSNSVTSLLQKLENSSTKGALSENLIFNVLHSLYPTADINHVGKIAHKTDIILKREGKPTILIENKNWNRNVKHEEVTKFISDVNDNKCAGILLSQNCGICNKESYQFEVHDGNVLIYVHNANNDPEKIKIAINIVDYFQQKLDHVNSETDTDVDIDTIPKEKLAAIQEEIKQMVILKRTMMKLTDDYCKKMTSQIEEIKIPTLEEYLNSRYATAHSTQVAPDNWLKCQHCGFIAKTKAGLGQHMRRCKAKSTDSSPRTRPGVPAKNIVIDIA